MILTLTQLAHKPVLRSFCDLYDRLDPPSRKALLELTITSGFEQVRVHYEGGGLSEKIANHIAWALGDRIVNGGEDYLADAPTDVADDHGAAPNEAITSDASSAGLDDAPPKAPPETVAAMKNLFGRNQ